MYAILKKIYPFFFSKKWTNGVHLYALSHAKSNGSRGASISACADLANQLQCCWVDSACAWKITDIAIVGYRWMEVGGHHALSVNSCKKVRGAGLASSYCMGSKNFFVSNQFYYISKIGGVAFSIDLPKNCYFLCNSFSLHHTENLITDSYIELKNNLFCLNHFSLGWMIIKTNLWLNDPLDTYTVKGFWTSGVGSPWAFYGRQRCASNHPVRLWEMSWHLWCPFFLAHTLQNASEMGQ